MNQNTQSSSGLLPTKQTSMARRIGSILTTKKKSKERNDSSNVSMSAIGDNSTRYSLDGDKSVAVTVSSQTTVKASNRKAKDLKRSSNKDVKGGWKGFKRLVGVSLEKTPLRGHARSEDFASDRSSRSTGAIWPGSHTRKRIFSEDVLDRNKKADVSSMSLRTTSQLDLAIRGRLDGVDMLSLGPASICTLECSPCGDDLHESSSKGITDEHEVAERAASDSSPGVDLKFDPMQLSFTGRRVACKPVDLVMNMIWHSTGKDQAELMLEGYIPGGGDRWSVKLGEETHEKGVEHEIPAIASTIHTSQEQDNSTAELTKDGSPNMPSHKLWEQIWGEDVTPPVPAHMQSGNICGDEEEDVLELAASCSVPIDLDEDTFIISSPEHFRSVHDLAMVPLQGRRFASAISIFDKMLKGFEEQCHPKFEHLQACTHHNIGILYMCLEKFSRALLSFQSAVAIRTRCLPQNHPDIAVSLMREGEANFALGHFTEALKSFRLARAMSPTEDATLAKMLNNSGVVYYHQESYSEALAAFTSALEIQRQWLDGPVRRESMVYDASVTLGNMGKVFLQMNKYEIAYSVFEEGCLLQTTAFRKDDDILISSLENMALVHAKNEEYEKASLILRSILRSKDSKFGSDHESTIETLGMLAFVLIKEMELEEGLNLLQKVSSWQERQMAPLHPSVQLTSRTKTAVENLVDGKASLWV